MTKLAQMALSVAVYFTFAYGLVSLLEAGKVRLKAWWAMRHPRDITGKAFPDIRRGVARPTDQRDLGDETQDIAAEGLGWNVPLGDLVYDRIQVRPPDRAREKHHPLGHRTRSFACLPDAEGHLWEAAIRASTQ